MTKQLDIILDEDIYEFVLSHNKKNPSAFISMILAEYKKQQFARELLLQMAEDDHNLQIKEELKNWDKF